MPSRTSSSASRRCVNTSTSELSYLVGAEAIERLPLNGRNYTDLALLQPGVIAYPHRDGGSVVAHGLGMSVNGQDPRVNVYLLDGTLQNDFTNGPAGSAAGTALGMDTIREFRVETNAYSAEFGRNSGGQINVLTKSGTNRFSGSAFEYHRNDALDATELLRRAREAGLHAQPVRRHARRADRTRPAVLLRRLRGAHRAPRPDDLHRRPRRQRRRGILPTGVVGVNPAVAPVPGGVSRAPTARSLGQGLATSTPFRSTRRSTSTSPRAGSTTTAERRDQLFARYTFDDADQFLPTDYPQFPRTFVSRNQFFTGEYRRDPVGVDAEHGAPRLQPHAHRPERRGQPVAAARAVRRHGASCMGDIDIGGMKRFGPQSSGNLRLVQNVFSFQDDLVHTRGRHLLKAGALVERYQDNMVNPTFSLGHLHLRRPQRVPRAAAPATFVGLTPEAQFDRYWRFTLFGFYAQDEFQVAPRLTRERRPALRVHDDAAREVRPRLGAAGPDGVAADGRPAVPEPDLHEPVAARRDSRGTSSATAGRRVRGGYGLYFNTNNQQNLIVTVTNPPFTPRPVIVNPTFPKPPFDRASAISMRPVQWDLDDPRVHVYNASVQRELPWQHRAHDRLRRVARPASAAKRRRQPGAAERHHAGRPAVHRRRDTAHQPRASRRSS